MLGQTASLLPRPVAAALAVVLGLQIAAVGFAPSGVSPRGTELADHATAVTLSLPAATSALEIETGQTGAGSTSSAPRTDVRSNPISDGTLLDVLSPWRADDALARAGRLSAPSTAPPLSGA